MPFICNLADKNKCLKKKLNTSLSDLINFYQFLFFFFTPPFSFNILILYVYEHITLT